MFCSYRNSYLQLPNAVNPRLMNRAVRRARRKTQFDPHDELPPAQRLVSMQPSLYAPWVDISRARLGFGRVGLRLISRDIHSDDSLVQLQAIHSLLDQVKISENAMFLINLNVVYRLIDLMKSPDPIVREKVALILTLLATYYEGRKRILSRPVAIDHLVFMIQRDRKEIRYAAALCLKTLTRDRCSCEIISRNEKIIRSLLKMIKNDHAGIILLHLESLKNLSEWDAIIPLKENAFQVMRMLIKRYNSRIVQAALDCMTQLCKHSVGQKLADKYKMTEALGTCLTSNNIEVVMSALGLMQYTTLTTRSKWRAKENLWQLTKRLIILAIRNNKPVVQMRAMQVLINLCDNSDIQAHLKGHWEKAIKGIKIRAPDQWDGTTEATSDGLDTGHYYRSMWIQNMETIKNRHGNNANAMNVYNYLKRVYQVKERLIRAMNKIPYKN